MLRQKGYRRPITLVGNEEPGPVDRPNLSKDYLAGKAPEESRFGLALLEQRELLAEKQVLRKKGDPGKKEETEDSQQLRIL